MSSDSQQTDRKKLTWLYVGLSLYFFAMLFAVRYAWTLPFQIFALCALFNMAIIFTFVFGIVRVLRRMRAAGRPQGDPGAQTKSQHDALSDERSLKLLWIGLGTYSLIFLNGLRLGFTYASSMPLPILILGELLNGAILATCIFELRKVQKRIRQRQIVARPQTSPTNVSTPD